jgi:hypothetical protein
MWRALIEALPLAQSFLALFYPAYGMLVDGQIHAESIVETITLARLKPFEELCKTLHLGPSADDVAFQPQLYRVVVAYTRAEPKKTFPIARQNGSATLRVRASPEWLPERQARALLSTLTGKKNRRVRIFPNPDKPRLLATNPHLIAPSGR